MPTKSPHPNFIIALSYIPVCIASLHCLASCSRSLSHKVWFILNGVLVLLFFSYKRMSGLRGLLMGGCTVRASIFLSNTAFRDVLQAVVSRNAGAHHWVLWHLFSITKPQLPSLVKHVAPTLKQVTPRHAHNLQQATGGRVLFLRASWAYRGGKSKG